MSTTLKIATWNINSVRLRQFIVERFLKEYEPDVLCLQETKCADAQFPSAAFKKIGYPHVAVNGGRGGYHGVAFVSRIALEEVKARSFCNKGDPRHLAAVVDCGGERLRLHNFYVPAGGDEPDPQINPKFAHKLAFLQEMAEWLPEASPDGLANILVGDLNVAPYESDVWSHKALLKVVSHTPVECEALEKARNLAGYTDLARKFVPLEEKLYTWWSYRAKDWRAADRGRRLDHIWTHANLADKAQGFTVLKDARDWPRPSDHVPVMATFAFG